jgi:transcriptional regulator with XRE-family HTH domain
MDAEQQISIRNKILGVLIKRARLKAGKSQRECAGLLGCSPSTYGQFERGRRGLSLPELEALAYLFDVPLDVLLNEHQAPEDSGSEEPLPIEQMMLLRRKMLAVQFKRCRHNRAMSQREMAELLHCSVNMVSQYERGLRDIPVAELELLAEHCGGSLDDFREEEMAPLTQSAQQQQLLARLEALPPDIRDFVLKPTNAHYFRVAMLLSDVKADSLRQIAEAFLEITY